MKGINFIRKKKLINFYILNDIFSNLIFIQFKYFRLILKKEEIN